MGAYAGPDISEQGLVLALDAANKKSYSQNEFQYSTDIYSWVTLGTRATLSRDTISSPVGNTPLKMEVTGNDPYTFSYNSSTWNIAPALNGETWIVSVYVKASVATTGEILIFGANSSGAAYVNGGWLSLTASTVNIGTEWTRVQHVHTMNNADVAYIHLRLDGPHSGGTGQTVWWDGLQVERVPSGTTTPTPFTSAYYGGSVFKDLVGSNNGTLTNRPTYSSSNNGSLVFDGVDDYGILTTNIFRTTLPNFTISVWYRKTVDGILFGNHYHNSTWESVWFSTTQFIVNGDNNNTTNRQILSYTATANSSTIWHNLVAVNNSSSNFMKVFLNGTEYATKSATVVPWNSTVPPTIGAQRNIATGGVLGPLTGNISNVSIYNRALTASEIQQNFNATRSRFGI